MVKKGHSAQLNHVSRTSVSWVSFEELQREHFRGSSLATITSPHASQYQAGILCPHHICREMHQSRMLCIQSKYVRSHMAGTIRGVSSSTALMAGVAKGLVLTNHCLERNGSTIVRQR